MQSDGKKHPAWRNDAYAKVTGKAKYTDDLKLPNCLYAVPVYTDFVSAKIIAIHTEEAAKQPGVVKVVTWQDIPGKLEFGQIIQDYPILAHDFIRSSGDVIALIVAKTRQEATAAVPFVKLEAEKLPAVLDAEEALKEGAPLVHVEHGSNIVNYHCVRRGDIKAGEEEADFVVEQEFNTSRVEHAYLEPEAALCWQRSDGVMEVYGSMQHPFSTRRFVASTLGKPLSDVEVKSVYVGGGFGGKDDTAAIVCARTALAAYLTGRPVKMTYTREWSLRESYKRHPYKLQYRVGVKKDGHITFAKIRIVADGGAYCSVTPWVTWRSTVQCCGPYVVPNVQCDLYGVYTNNIFCGAMRGFGSPQVNFAVEQLIEMAAEKCGLDEIEMRRCNLVKKGSITITGQTLEDHEVSLQQVLDLVLKESDYYNKRKLCSWGNPNQEEWYGIGLALSYRGMSLGAEGTDFNSAIINVQQDGSILLETAIHENGQGSESAMILLCAEHLSVNKERIRYRQSSTSNIPDGGTTVASRGTLMGGGAVVKAAEKLKAQMARVLANDLHCAPEEVIFENEYLYNTDKSCKISFNEAIRLMYSRQEYPYSFGVFQAPQVTWDEKTGQGKAYFTWVYGCQAVELKVNPHTGKITLLNMIAAHDVGKAVNPEVLKGQFYGGMAMGAGYGMLEKCELENGKVVPANLHQYKILRSTDLPDMTAIIVENYDPLSPSGAKGIGEPANELMAPAIANAVYHATGIRFPNQPVTILGTIKETQEGDIFNAKDTRDAKGKDAIN
ncbi:MAG: xanthine dehydrogenase family protein molybdopterin-binding subunit [Candidatus Cloacimonadaceae bacterium]